MLAPTDHQCTARRLARRRRQSQAHTNNKAAAHAALTLPPPPEEPADATAADDPDRVWLVVWLAPALSVTRSCTSTDPVVSTNTTVALAAVVMPEKAATCGLPSKVHW